MRISAVIFMGVTLLATTPAWAASVVLTDAVGRNCYQGTLLPPSPTNDRLALAACNQAVDDPDVDHVGALVNRADIRVKLGNYSDAVADADRALAISPNFAPAYLNRGAGLLGLKRYQDSIDALNLSIKLGVEKLSIAYLNRGLAREGLEDIQGAYHDYKMAQNLEPDFQQAAKELSRFRVVTN